MEDHAHSLGPSSPRAAGRTSPARASAADAMRVMVQVFAPLIAKGVLLRRPRMVALSAHWGLDGKAVRCLQAMRRTYGEGPLMLAIPGRPQIVLLAPDDVDRVLVREPDAFAPASLEKRTALAHFEPNVSLISREPDRPPRRRLHDRVLESGSPVHSMAQVISAIVEKEMGSLLARQPGVLDWPTFAHGWNRVARRLIFGDAAADDTELNAMLVELRAAGNWAFVRPKRRNLLHRFQARLAIYLEAAAPRSLAEVLARHAEGGDSRPVDQVSQWLFAFDTGCMGVFRAMALLASQPGALHRVRAEGAAAVATGRPFTRACLLEALRLWPTTPAILRETTRPATWPDGTVEAGTQVIVFTPFFHRDNERLPEADRFSPHLWLEPRDDRSWPLIPFSAGAGLCPAHHLFPLVVSAALPALVRGHDLRIEKGQSLDPNAPLPGTLDHFRLEFAMTPARR